ncbi:hypothetical protein [Cohnella sp. AR92]|uniref:hypothetical protein n=1 Tax=Cohnella sp. AR92 TaxID=648716 RepID=UPI000F8E964F|nr:hypothetical protein [Cohnella sp. AR92]RUS47307.1 hypothetical protein ELR57_09260 [Cohnella sp. AR92]
MKINTTKLIKLIITLLLIAIISFSVLVAVFKSLLGNLLWSTWDYRVRDFDTYRSDFQTIADLAYREFSKGQMKDSYILVTENSDGSVHFSYENSKTETMVEAALSQRERTSLENIMANAFHQGDMAYLSVIRVRKDQVEFGIENGLYSLVNRRDGHKPKSVNALNTKRHYKLKKITDHWYHAWVVE